MAAQPLRVPALSPSRVRPSLRSAWCPRPHRASSEVSDLLHIAFLDRHDRSVTIEVREAVRRTGTRRRHGPPPAHSGPLRPLNPGSVLHCCSLLACIRCGTSQPVRGGPPCPGRPRHRRPRFRPDITRLREQQRRRCRRAADTLHGRAAGWQGEGGVVRLTQAAVECCRDPGAAWAEQDAHNRCAARRPEEAACRSTIPNCCQSSFRASRKFLIADVAARQQVRSCFRARLKLAARPRHVAETGLAPLKFASSPKRVAHLTGRPGQRARDAPPDAARSDHPTPHACAPLPVASAHGRHVPLPLPPDSSRLR